MAHVLPTYRLKTYFLPTFPAAALKVIALLAGNPPTSHLPGSACLVHRRCWAPAFSSAELEPVVGHYSAVACPGAAVGVGNLHHIPPVSRQKA